MMLNYFFRGNILALCIKYYRENFLRRKYLFIKPGHTLVSDDFYLNQIFDSKTPYILVMIYGYTSYLNIKPLQSLNASCVVPLFEKILKGNIHI